MNTGKILRRTSRSFYLTLRLLPRAALPLRRLRGEANAVRRIGDRGVPRDQRKHLTAIPVINADLPVVEVGHHSSPRFLWISANIT